MSTLNCLAGWHCPSCHNVEGDRYQITMATCRLVLTDNGTTQEEHFDYPGDAMASCIPCGYRTTVSMFLAGHCDACDGEDDQEEHEDTPALDPYPMDGRSFPEGY